MEEIRHAQHGFCAERSTMAVFLLFINMLKKELAKGEVLHTCSWDITCEFNSVSKNIMRLAWTSLRVPRELAHELVYLNESVMTVVRTPYTIKSWNGNRRDGLKC